MSDQRILSLPNKIDDQTVNRINTVNKYKQIVDSSDHQLKTECQNAFAKLSGQQLKEEDIESIINELPLNGVSGLKELLDNINRKNPNTSSYNRLLMVLVYFINNDFLNCFNLMYQTLAIRGINILKLNILQILVQLKIFNSNAYNYLLGLTGKDFYITNTKTSNISPEMYMMDLIRDIDKPGYFEAFKHIISFTGIYYISYNAMNMIFNSKKGNLIDFMLEKTAKCLIVDNTIPGNANVKHNPFEELISGGLLVSILSQDNYKGNTKWQVINNFVNGEVKVVQKYRDLFNRIVGASIKYQNLEVFKKMIGMATFISQKSPVTANDIERNQPPTDYTNYKNLFNRLFDEYLRKDTAGKLNPKNFLNQTIYNMIMVLLNRSSSALQFNIASIKKIIEKMENIKDDNLTYENAYNLIVKLINSYEITHEAKNV